MLFKLLLILSTFQIPASLACDDDDIEEIARQAGHSVPDRRAANERMQLHHTMMQKAAQALTARPFVIIGHSKNMIYSFRQLPYENETIRDLMATAYAGKARVPHILELFAAQPIAHYHKASFSIWGGETMLGVFTLSVDHMEMFFEHHPVHLINENEALAAELKLAIYRLVIPVIDEYREHEAALVEAVANDARDYHDRLKELDFALGRARTERLLTPPESTVFRYPETMRSRVPATIRQISRPILPEQAPAEIEELVGAH